MGVLKFITTAISVIVGGILLILVFTSLINGDFGAVGFFVTGGLIACCASSLYILYTAKNRTNIVLRYWFAFGLSMIPFVLIVIFMCLLSGIEC